MIISVSERLRYLEYKICLSVNIILHIAILRPCFIPQYLAFNPRSSCCSTAGAVRQRVNCYGMLLFHFWIVLLSANIAWSSPSEQGEALPNWLPSCFTTQWSARMEVQEIGPPGWSVAISEKYVIASCTGGNLVCLDLGTGTRKWQKSLGSFRGTMPLMGARCAFVLIDLKELLGVDISTGDIRWRFADGAELGLHTVAKNCVLIGSNSGNVYAISELSGDIIWHDNVGSAATARPGVLGDICCFGTASGLLTAYDVVTGKMLWKTQLGGGIDLPIIAGKSEFIISAENDTVSAYSPDTGEMLWQRGAEANFAPPYSTGDKVVVFGRFGSFRSLGPE